MVGKIIIGGFGMLVILYGSTWQWRLIGVVFATCAVASAAWTVLLRPRPKVRRPTPPPAPPPAPAKVTMAEKKAKKAKAVATGSGDGARRQR